MSGRARTVVWLCLVVPSLAQVQKHLGAAGLAIYPIVAWLVLGYTARWKLARIDESRALLLAAGTFLAVIAVFAIMYPLANAGRFGPGSDTDDAYDLAVREMLAGRYPYYPRTYLGNRIHHLPGGLVLATPFVLLGTSAYQNLFWLVVLYWVARNELGGAREALLMLWTLFALSPAILQQTVTGGDGVMNPLSVLAALSCMTRRPAVGALPLALALSNRQNFLLVLGPLAGYLAHDAGPRPAVRWIGLIGALLAAINLPFLLYDPPEFAPLESANRLTRFSGTLPHAGLILPVAAGALAIALGWRCTTRRVLWLSCAAVQALLVVSGLILSGLQTRSIELSYSNYGAFFMFFGVLGVWELFRLPSIGRA